jgi:DNA-binding MarR family transcriptional regulator
MKKTADTVLTAMFELGRIIKKNADGSDALPLSYLETLRFTKEKEHPTMRDIAEYLRITAPSATALVEVLVHAGYLKRVADKDDRRVVRLTLSPSGNAVLTRTFKHRMSSLRKVIEKLSDTDQKELARILSKLLAQ